MEAGWLDPVDLSAALIDVMNERDRQVNEEGFTPEHDDAQWRAGELAGAASAYAMSASASMALGRDVVLVDPPPFFLFGVEHWKPTTPRRDAVKACALLLAEIERLDRRATTAATEVTK